MDRLSGDKEGSSREVQSKLKKLDQRVESRYVDKLRFECRKEQEYRDRLVDESWGLFFANQEKLEKARQYDMKNCRRLREMSLL
ncbi:unnamed protein product [Ambrosiozyma monospora]|uniref:Unnamed protein product n=1 Tax=Ambrosiozyma monospora TaxID=43982 RepID=A0A9W6YYS4_AMBMO|nr:unnamed protein product [Ambrosiozyma monospora]